MTKENTVLSKIDYLTHCAFTYRVKSFLDKNKNED